MVDITFIASVVAALTGGLLAIAVYMAPWLVSWVRDTEHKKAIFWFTLLTGWTTIGWLCCFIWAVVEKQEDF